MANNGLQFRVHDMLLHFTIRQLSLQTADGLHFNHLHYIISLISFQSHGR